MPPDLVTFRAQRGVFLMLDLIFLVGGIAGIVALIVSPVVEADVGIWAACLVIFSLGLFLTWRTLAVKLEFSDAGVYVRTIGLRRRFFDRRTDSAIARPTVVPMDPYYTILTFQGAKGSRATVTIGLDWRRNDREAIMARCWGKPVRRTSTPT